MRGNISLQTFLTFIFLDLDEDLLARRGIGGGVRSRQRLMEGGGGLLYLAEAVIDWMRTR